ncbi:MAG: glucan phosphoethanolaminetransferase (alkaline phosphatase superfamily) [Vicingaceae bacterium]|jgi:glucan phosphoethanolaminetransferase (alkaline phosphatase superfamily)
MKKTEKILLLIALLGLTFKLFHWPGASALLILSLSALSVFYMYFSFAFFNGIELRKVFKKESYTGISTLRIVGAIGTGLGLSVALVGILFKLSFWPGATMQLITGLAVLLIVTVISFFKLKNSNDGYYFKVLKRAVPVVSICITLIYIPTQVWLELRYPNNPEYVQALIEAEANPSNSELWEKVDEEKEKMMEEKNNY